MLAVPLLNYNQADEHVIYNSQAWITRIIKQNCHTRRVLDILDTGTNNIVLVERSLSSLLNLSNPNLVLRFEDESDVVFFDMSDLGRIT